MPGDLPGDTALALDAARRAGELLLELRVQALDEPADVRADRLIASILSAARPGDAIRSEEVASVGDRARADRVWIVDPLDGTREYQEPGRSDWAVHVALWVRGVEGDPNHGEPNHGDPNHGDQNHGDLTEGVVALPDPGEVWSTTGPAAAPVDRPITRIVVSRSRPPAWALAVADELGADVIPMGSAGAKTAAVLRGDADAYLHDGGQYEWDSAAPVAVARHHGYHASRADGSALRYNRTDPYLPDLVVCPKAQAGDLLARIARHRVPVATAGRVR